ncbi:hypothetical protein GCM10022393_17940 [Aquimarina addita]|uniref:T9SS type A sorting domain-containing protein n=1 Tax=Aquimarina addita TaxID=870485 RepID=A0ABP6UJD1_9FLAO
MTPSGEFNGAVVNPDLLRDTQGNLLANEDQKQGLLNPYDFYSADLNIMNNLPYNASAGESIYKIKAKNTGCGTRYIEIGCVDTAVVLTILAEVPLNNGSTSFRPPVAGTWKPLYTIDKVRMDRLPRLPQISDGSHGTIGGPRGFEDWLVPQVDLYGKVSGFGEFFRGTVPHAAQPDYGATQSQYYLESISQLFGLETNEEKEPGTYSLMQRGIDIYAIYKMGISFSSGAGQFAGKKPALTFFAAMYDDLDILNEVRAIASDPNALENTTFQEDSQIYRGVNGVALWGDQNGLDNIHWYFSALYPRLDTQGSSADPYGYIDGPAGGIHPDPDQTRDRQYVTTVGGVFIGYAFLQNLMPWYAYAAGDPEIIEWSDRIYRGYGVDNFDGGLWTAPDPVAPVDSNDYEDCNPFRLYSTGVTGCSGYMETWGPSPEDFSNYIAHNGDPMTDGRMPLLHGHQLSFTRLIRVVQNHWDELRPCSDPNNPSYPCDGLGSTPNTLSVDTPGVVELENMIVTSITNQGITVSDRTEKFYDKIAIKLYSITGALIAEKNGNGTELTLEWNESATLSKSEVYIVQFYMDDKKFVNKIVVSY